MLLNPTLPRRADPARAGMAGRSVAAVAPSLCAFAPPRAPVRRTRRRGARGQTQSRSRSPYGDCLAWQPERSHPPSSVVRRATPLVRAQALPERMEAPAGLAYPSPFPLPGGAGLIQPAGLARPQIGLQPAGGAQRWNAPARQGSTYLRTAINAQSSSARRRRTRAGTPAHPGRTCFNHSAHRSRR